MSDRNRLADLLTASGACVAIALFASLPLRPASALGGWLGRRFGPLFKVHKWADRNLAYAMPGLDMAARRRILDGMWNNLGRVVAEYAHLADIRPDTPEQRHQIEVTGAERVEALRTGNRPVILFSAHYGNWELLSVVATSLGMPLLQVYRAANNPLAEALLQRLRRPVGGRHVPKGAEAAREMLKALKRNEPLALLVDQKLNTGIAVPFFGRDAMTAPAIAEFALRFDCLVVPARTERLGGTRFRVTIEEPIEFARSGNHDADVYNAMVTVNRRVEDWIRDRPDHWFWVHRRWPKD